MARIKISLAVLLILLVVGARIAPPAVAETPPAPPSTWSVTLQMQPPVELITTDDPTLPVGLANIFAILGVYIVTMFTMAIGTEVVVDIVKVTIGLKSKPEAMKTLQEYENLLPGRLEDLGLSAQAQADLQNQVASLRTMLAPAFKAEEVVFHLREKRFKEALQTAVAEEGAGSLIEKAQAVVKAEIHTAVAGLDHASLPGRILNDQLLAELDKAIDQTVAAAGNIPPEELFRLSVDLLNGKTAEAITAWTEQQLKELQNVSYDTAQHLYASQIKPQIQISGLAPETQARIDLQFQSFLENIKISHQADIYLQTVNNLLMEVEKRRDETTGLLDRWWTHLRYWGRRQLSRVFTSIAPNPKHKKRGIIIDHPLEAATKLLEIRERDKQEAAFRVQQLRILSVIVAVALAWALQIDSADILQGLFPNDANFLYIIIVPENLPLFLWFQRILGITPKALTAGILLTGLAASAGSSFWHDQLQRLQTTHKSAEAANAALQPIIIKTQERDR